MINAFELSFISGIMFGIEFPDMTNAFLVLDLGILRIVWYRVSQEELDEINKM